MQEGEDSYDYFKIVMSSSNLPNLFIQVLLQRIHITREAWICSEGDEGQEATNQIPWIYQQRSPIFSASILIKLMILLFLKPA